MIPKVRIKNVWASYRGTEVLRDLSFDVNANEVLAIIGPAGGGKTTFLRLLNRLNDDIDGFSFGGEIYVDEEEIYGEKIDVARLRRRIGMVFATPNPLPRSIYENVAFGPKLRGVTNKSELDALVARSLQEAQLWDEVKDRLELNALRLSGGQQQRMCLARALALEPEIVLLDEPSSGLDPISTHKLEETLRKLRTRHTIILVTNNIKQAARVGDRVAFFLMGQLIELGETNQIFTNPKDQRTEDYIEGKFG